MARHAPGEPAEIVLAERRLPYRLQRSPRRRTVAVCVDPERGVIVYAPLRMAQRRVDGFLREKQHWILAKTSELERQQRGREPLECAPGNLLPFQGAWYPLAVESNGRRCELSLQGGVLWLGLPARTLQRLEAEGLRGTALREHVVAGYREAARRVLEERMAHYAACLAVRPAALRVKDQQRRWGSASAKGGLNFNWRLVLAPPPVLDYVVVHELCHLVELNHSPRFWAQVAAVLPDYRERQAWLREHGPGLYDL
ncbi:MAG TPA: SprT family zinc-dependent metalloprotease [bacterium]|nr:SprT family zinc-dependent metalloprotease [bacterium]